MIPLEECAEAIARHERIALQWSGGKDATATLFYLRPFWDKLTVYWLTTGDTPTETVELARLVEAEVPRFEVVTSNVEEYICQRGFPVELVPEKMTRLGAMIHGASPKFFVSPRLECCAHNIMFPMQRKMIEDGITLIIRGQKSSDKYRNHLICSGAVVDGVEFLLPTEDETDESILKWVEENAPDFKHLCYYLGDTGLTDCLHCTAQYGDGDALASTYPGVMELKQEVWEAVRLCLQ